MPVSSQEEKSTRGAVVVSDDVFQAQESLAVKRLTERMRQLLQEGKTQAAVMSDGCQQYL